MRVRDLLRGFAVGAVLPLIANGQGPGARDFAAFDSALAAGRFITPSATSAWAAYERLLTVPGTSARLPELARRLSDSLIALARRVPTRYVSDDNNFPSADSSRLAARAAGIAATLRPDSAVSWRALEQTLTGLAFFDQGSYGKAVAQFRAAQATIPQQPWVLSALASSYLDLDSLTTAESLFARVIRTSPAWARPYRNYGQLLLRRKRYSDAIASYKRALSLDSTYAYAWINLGQAYFRNGQIDSATRAWHRAGALDAEETVVTASEEFQAEKRWIAAESVYVSALETMPGSARIRADLGYVLVQQDRFADADDQFRATLAVDSTNSQARRGEDFLIAAKKNRASGRATSSDRSSVTAVLKAGLKHASNASDSGAAYFRAGSDAADFETHEGYAYAVHYWEAALDYFRRAGPRSSRAVDVEFRIGNAFEKLGEPDSAGRHLSTSAAVAGASGNDTRMRESLARAGIIYGQYGRRDSARAYLERAIAEAARAGDAGVELDARSRLAIVLHDQFRDGRSGLTQLESAVQLAQRLHDQGETATLLNNIAFFFDGLAQPDSAIHYYRAAIDLANGSSADKTAYLNLARHYSDAGMPDSAVVLLHALIARAQRQRSGGDEAAAWLQLGRTLRASANFDRASVVADSAVAAFTASVRLARADHDTVQLVDALESMASAQAALHRTSVARLRLQEALDLRLARGDQEGAAGTVVQIADIYAADVQLDSVRWYEKRAYDAYRALNESRFEAQALLIVSRTFSQIARFDSALVYLQRAITTVPDTSVRLRATLFQAAGSVYASLGRLDSVHYYMKRALDEHHRAGEPAADVDAASALLEAEMLAAAGRIDSSLVLFRQANAIRPRVTDPSVARTILSATGDVFRRYAHRPDSALAYYREALTEPRDGSPSARADIENSLGGVFADLHQADSARAYFGRALPVFRREKTDAAVGGLFADLATLGISGAADSAAAHFTAALVQARQQGRRESESAELINLARLDRGGHRTAMALAHYDSAAAVRASVAASAGDDENRVALTQRMSALYQEWLSTVLTADSSQNGAFAALAVVERGRGQGLLALMQESAGAIGLGLRDTRRLMVPGTDLVAEGRQLARDLGRSAGYTMTFAAVGDTLLTWLVEPSGNLRLWHSIAPRDTVTRLVRGMRAAIAARDSTGGKGAREIARRLEIHDPTALAEIERGFGVDQDEADTLALRRLSEILLPQPVLRELPKGGDLVIVPQGALALIPFAALTDEGGRSLGERFALRFAPSMETVREVSAARADIGDQAWRRRALIVGNPTMPTELPGLDGSLPALPAAEHEADDVAALLSVPALTGADATERTVEARLPDASIVHLATHGFAFSEAEKARLSFIALAPSPGYDGVLTVDKLLLSVPRLSAELVVLSACETGLGTVTDAEGTIGLQRALLSKGAHSVIVSLWNVSDEATHELMVAFYRHWLTDPSHPDKPHALQLAISDLRRDPRYRAPRYWAAFQLIGDR